ncbi:MAG: hypothetical protein U5L11_01055 [Arhodomonas sp.]|nr:hypothetical protein [Arhodomonas sp.]
MRKAVAAVILAAVAPARRAAGRGPGTRDGGAPRDPGRRRRASTNWRGGRTGPRRSRSAGRSEGTARGGAAGANAGIRVTIPCSTVAMSASSLLSGRR